MYKCIVVISKEKEIITDKDLLYNEVKEAVKRMDKYHIFRSIVANAIIDSRNKQIVEEEINVLELDLPRNEFPIDELEYDGKVYKFLKIRLTVDSSNNPLIKYIFDGGEESLDRRPLVDEYAELILQDEEINLEGIEIK